MDYKILEHPADLKIQAFGKTKEEVFLNMAKGMQDALRPNFQFSISKKGEASLPYGAGNFQTKRGIKVKSANLETLLVDFLSEILYQIQANKEIYNDIKFKKFQETEIEAELRGKKVESFGEDIKAVTYHDLEIKQNENGVWQATVLFDI